MKYSLNTACFFLSLHMDIGERMDRNEKNIYRKAYKGNQFHLSGTQTITMLLPDRAKQQETANEASHPLSLQCLA